MVINKSPLILSSVVQVNSKLPEENALYSCSYALYNIKSKLSVCTGYPTLFSNGILRIYTSLLIYIIYNL